MNFHAYIKNKGAALRGYIVYPWNPAPLLLFFILGDTLLASGVSPFGFSFSRGYSLGFWCIPLPCPNLLVDTLCSFGVSPFLLIFLLGYNFSLWGIHLPCHNLLGDTACAFDVSPFLLIFLLGYNFSFLGYPSALSQLAWGYTLGF